MTFEVTNENIEVTEIKIVGVATASVVLIGDADTITSVCTFDTPPESVITGFPFVPLSGGAGGAAAAGVAGSR